MSLDPTGHISLQRNPQRVRVLIGDRVIADTHEAVELRETGYPVRQYIPRQDVVTECLRQSATTSHCPYKGDATYYSIELDGRLLHDAVWSYEQPFTAMADIKGRLAFDTQLVEQIVGN